MDKLSNHYIVVATLRNRSFRKLQLYVYRSLVTNNFEKLYKVRKLPVLVIDIFWLRVWGARTLPGSCMPRWPSYSLVRIARPHIRCNGLPDRPARFTSIGFPSVSTRIRGDPSTNLEPNVPVLRAKTGWDGTSFTMKYVKTDSEPLLSDLSLLDSHFDPINLVGGECTALLYVSMQ